jgi:hypothetical protein
MGEKAVPSSPKVGILIVHGIGRQKFGSTLMAGCDPLVEWLRERLGKQLSNAPVEVVGAELREEDLPENTPAHARVRVRSSAGEEETWLVAESWWASSFPEPRYSEVVRWTLVSGIVAIAADAADRYGRISKQWANRNYLGVVGTIFELYLTLLVFTPILLPVGVLTAASFIPWIRRFVLRLQEGLTGSIGDSFALTKGTSRSAAIINKTVKDISWLTSQGVQSLVVVAHSRGPRSTSRSVGTGGS